MWDPLYAKWTSLPVKEQHSCVHIHRNGLSAVPHHLHLDAPRETTSTRSEVSCWICLISYQNFFQPDLPERSGPAAVWRCSWQVLRWWVLVQVGVGWAALPGCDWSLHLVTLLTPLWEENLQRYDLTSVILKTSSPLSLKVTRRSTLLLWLHPNSHTRHYIHNVFYCLDPPSSPSSIASFPESLLD